MVKLWVKGCINRKTKQSLHTSILTCNSVEKLRESF
jgi:hypothetical protein